MMSNEINLEELEALANAAGGVKWIACGPSYGEAKPAFLDEVNVDDDEHPESVCQYPAGCRSDVSDKMAYIAEANPATLLSLLDRLKSAEAERDALVAKWRVAQGMADCMEMLRSEMLAAGVIDANVAPMFFPESIIPRLRRLAELEGQEPVAWVEVVSPHEGPYNFNGITLLGKGIHHLYARPVPAEPVNARLLEVLKGLMALSDHRVDLRDQAKAARSAIAAAEAQQERLLQDMHDAGREIDRVMDEPAPKVPQIDLDAIARAIWNVRRQEEDRCDMELEDMRRDHSVWKEATEVASILKDAGIEVAE